MVNPGGHSTAVGYAEEMPTKNGAERHVRQRAQERARTKSWLDVEGKH